MTKKYPIVEMKKADPLQDQYHDGTGSYWGIARLIDDTKNLVPFDCPVAALNLSDVIWRGNNILDLAVHCKKANDSDLSKPVIIFWDGSIADGRHRIIKAIIKGKRTIKAVRMTWRPEPCGTDKV